MQNNQNSIRPPERSCTPRAEKYLRETFYARKEAYKRLCDEQDRDWFNSVGFDGQTLGESYNAFERSRPYRRSWEEFFRREPAGGHNPYAPTPHPPLYVRDMRDGVGPDGTRQSFGVRPGPAPSGSLPAFSIRDVTRQMFDVRPRPAPSGSVRASSTQDVHAWQFADGGRLGPY